MNENDKAIERHKQNEKVRAGFFKGIIKPDRYEFMRGIRRGMEEFEIKGDEDDE